jgi:XisI protein
MDRLTRYRQIARNVIEEYSRHKVSHGDIQTEPVIDPVRDHYEVIHTGWDRGLRVHGTIVHLDIIDGKFWVQYDGTDRPVVDELEAAGVPKEDIVLAWHPSDVRPHTGYAVG